MGIHGLKKVIAITVLVAFIGIGVAWAMEQGSPQFQEKAGTPVIKKHKKFPWLLAVLGVAVVGVGVYFLTKKKNENSGVVYTIILQNKDVVTDAAVNGNLTVKLANGTQVTGTSGGQFKLIDSNSISDVVVTNASGHYTGYAVFTDSDGNVVAFKDRDGMNKSFTVTDGKQYFVRLISDSIDPKLLANCVGNNIPGKDAGDGTIQNYNTSDANVNGVVQKRAAIMKGTENPQDPTDYTVATFKRALDMLNAIPGNRVKWTYVGIVTEKLTDGMTYITKKVSPGGASDVSSNTINWSFFSAPADIEFGTVLEEVVNNGGSGIFYDAQGYDGHDGGRSPYIGGNADNPVWINNAEYAIALSNGPLPRGFRLSTNSVPASQLPSPMSISQPGSLMSTGSTREYAPIGSVSRPEGRYSVPKPVVGRDVRVKEQEER
jgi:hypothetical protein